MAKSTPCVSEPYGIPDLSFLLIPGSCPLVPEALKLRLPLGGRSAKASSESLLLCVQHVALPMVA